MWTGPPRRHFTFECSTSSDAANLSQETSPGQDPAPADTAQTGTSDRTFLEDPTGHRAAAEGDD